MRKLAYLVAASAVGMYGCGSSGSSKTSSGTASTSTGTTGSPPPPAPGTDPGADAKAIAEQLEKATQNIEPPAPGKEGWTKSTAKAEDFASAAESKIASLKNVGGGSTAQVRLEQTPGMSISMINIVSPSKFYIEFAQAQTKPNIDLQKEALVADGKSYANMAMSTSGWSAKKPVEQLRLEGNTSVETWLTSSTRQLFSALQGGKPLTNLLKSARSHGMVVTVEERVKKGKTRTANQHRFLITRTPSDVEKMGRMEYEVVFDDFFKLPVTIRSTAGPAKGKVSSVAFTLGWDFKPAKFDESKFVIGKPTAAPLKTQKT